MFTAQPHKTWSDKFGRVWEKFGWDFSAQQINHEIPRTFRPSFRPDFRPIHKSMAAVCQAQHNTLLTGSGVGAHACKHTHLSFGVLNPLTNPGTTPITILAVNSDHGLSVCGGGGNSDHGLSFLFYRDSP